MSEIRVANIERNIGFFSFISICRTGIIISGSQLVQKIVLIEEYSFICKTKRILEILNGILSDKKDIMSLSSKSNLISTYLVPQKG